MKKEEEEGIEQPSSLKDTLLPCPFDFSDRFGGSGSEKWQKENLQKSTRVPSQYPLKTSRLPLLCQIGSGRVEQPLSLKPTIMPLPFQIPNQFRGSGSKKWQKQ
jgi:hypothetical protein